MATVAVSDAILDELVQICGEEHVFAGASARFNRARVPSPFPVHRWEDYVPDAVVLPTSAEQISEVVKLANRERVPVVPRAGGTGLTDGAVPLRHGIMVDVKLMNRILELDLVISFEIVLPTGAIIRVGDGGGKKVRKSSSGYQLKHLFMGHQGTLGIVTEATLELVKRPEAEFSAFYAYPAYLDAWRATGEFARSGAATLAGVVLFDEWKLAYLRRDDEAYIPQPDWVKGVVAVAMYGNDDEVRASAKRMLRIGKASGGTYLGDEISQGDWASRHDRYATPQHGRTRDGQVALMSWHCEDASILYSQLPAVREKWHAIAAGLRERFDMFDDWGMFAYTNGAFKPWGDYLTEIDIGIWEMQWDDESWAAWVDAKREIARVAVEHGGSISACHGACRDGEVDLVPEELGGGFEVMKKIKRALDPNNIMNPGKYLLDQAYEDDEG